MNLLQAGRRLAVTDESVHALVRAGIAIGRLDGVAGGATDGIRRLLELRAAVVPLGRGPDGMIAILRGDGEGEQQLTGYSAELHRPLAPEERADAGLLHVLLDARERRRDGGTARDISLVFSRTLWSTGALGGAWLAMPFTEERMPSAFGDERVWIDTFAAALEREATAAIDGIARARERMASDEKRVAALGRASYSALDLFHLLGDRLILSVSEAAVALGQTVPTAGAAMERLVAVGAAREVTGKARDRRFAYRALVNGVGP